MQDPLLRKMRMLTQLIIFSAALNIGLISSLIYIVAEKKWHRQQKIEIAPISSLTNATVIRTFFAYSYQDLLRELVDTQLVEYGYTRRDLALACLVQFHYFDIERALANTELQKRELEFIHRDGGEHVKLTVYPGLSDAHFESVKLLAAREEWPLTSEGLFYELKKNEGSLSASSLQEAFFATHEFYTLYTLCARSFEGISQEEVLTLLLEGSWSCIHNFVVKVRSVSDLSLDHLRKF
ncbi:MAG: hypothetical protein FJZ56_04680, partial [Chlamydiae bacterium]|nr:hypothetical protein [Chlamydiota bacterium]